MSEYTEVTYNPKTGIYTWRKDGQNGAADEMPPDYAPPVTSNKTRGVIAGKNGKNSPSSADPKPETTKEKKTREDREFEEKQANAKAAREAAELEAKRRENLLGRAEDAISKAKQSVKDYFKSEDGAGPLGSNAPINDAIDKGVRRGAIGYAWDGPFKGAGVPCDPEEGESGVGLGWLKKAPAVGGVAKKVEKTKSGVNKAKEYTGFEVFLDVACKNNEVLAVGGAAMGVKETAKRLQIPSGEEASKRAQDAVDKMTGAEPVSK